MTLPKADYRVYPSAQPGLLPQHSVFIATLDW